VAIARTGETVHALTEQLRALHSAILSMLTAKVEQRLADRPGLDVRPLLHGGAPLLTNLIRLSNRSPTVWLDALPVLPLPTAMRNRVRVQALAPMTVVGRFGQGCSAPTAHAHMLPTLLR